MKCLFKKIFSFLLLSLIFPWFSYGEKEEVDLFVEGGVKNNAQLKEPQLVLDTSFNISLSKIKSFPSWGYYLGVKAEKKLFENVEGSIGVRFETDKVIGKVDSSTAIFQQIYFADPLIEQVYYTSKISFPIYLSYFRGKFSLGIGVYNSFFFWTSKSQSLLSGTFWKDEKKFFGIHPEFPISLNLKYKISNKVGVDLSYDFPSEVYSPFKWIKLGFEYRIKSL